MKNENVLAEIIKNNPDKTVYKITDHNRCMIMKKAITLEGQVLLQHEINLHKMIEDNSLVIPGMLETDEETCLTEEYIEGDTLAGIDIKGLQVKSMLDGIKQLHKVNIEQLLLKYPEFHDWKTYLTGKIQGYVDKIINNKLLKWEEIQPVVKYVEDIIAHMDYSNNESVLLHNDLNMDNIIVLKDGSVKFIDFERWIIGDPLKEMSKMVWWIRKDKSTAQDLYSNLVSHNLIEDDLERLKAYFYYDILFHLSLHEELHEYPIWEKYYDEELKLIQAYETFRLW